MTGVGMLKIRGRAKHIGSPKTLELQHKQGKWYASVTLDCASARAHGQEAIAIDWGLETFATIAKHDMSIDAVENPRILRTRLQEIRTKQRALSRKKRSSNNRRKAKKCVA